MAIRTGIPPMELINTPPEIFAHMVRYTLGKPKTAADLWDAAVKGITDGR
jgi:hypothetical protein